MEAHTKPVGIFRIQKHSKQTLGYPSCSGRVLICGRFTHLIAPTGQAMTARRTSWNSASLWSGRGAASVKTCIIDEMVVCGSTCGCWRVDGKLHIRRRPRSVGVVRYTHALVHNARTVGSLESARASRKTSGARTRQTTQPVHFCVTTTLPKSSMSAGGSRTAAAGGAMLLLGWWCCGGCRVLTCILRRSVMFGRSIEIETSPGQPSSSSTRRRSIDRSIVSIKPPRTDTRHY